MTEKEAAKERERMVAEQLEARGILDRRVLAAMRKVPRERYVGDAMVERAYEDAPLPIGSGQTISQPYMVARMTELAQLRGRERVLEIGAGSGYQTAVLCELAKVVYAVEVRPELARLAESRLRAAGYRRFEIGIFDGSQGFADRAPFDVILVTAGAPQIPTCLVDQLADGGRLIIPIGPRQGQRLSLVLRSGDDYSVDWTTPCSFADLAGKYGWGGHGPAKA